MLADFTRIELYGDVSIITGSLNVAWSATGSQCAFAKTGVICSYWDTFNRSLIVVIIMIRAACEKQNIGANLIGRQVASLSFDFLCCIPMLTDYCILSNENFTHEYCISCNLEGIFTIIFWRCVNFYKHFNLFSQCKTN